MNTDTKVPAPEICVVIPLFNAEAWIARTIQSVLDEGLSTLRVIVIDDGSTDASYEIAKSFGARILVETGPNRGACFARNRGQALAQEMGAGYVLFLDSDDYVEGGMIAGALALSKTEPAPDMILSNMHIEYPDGTRSLRPLYSGRVPAEAFFEGWMRGEYVNPSAILWRVDFVDQINGWDESLTRAQDQDITLRAMLADPLIVKNETGAAIYAQVNQGSISNVDKEHALDSRFRALSGLVMRVQGTHFETNKLELYRDIYRVARLSFKNGYRALGRRAVTFLKSEGYHEHPGTRAHARIAGILGLETKIWLWKG